MKKIYLSIIISVLLCGYSIAQPTFTSSNWAAFGTVITTTSLDSASAVPGSSGANQSWNFSGATPTGNVSASTLIDPASTPFASSFPGTNAASTASGGSGSNAYVYYMNGSNKAEMLGFASDDTSGVILSNFSDPQTLVTYPFTYLSTFTDSYSSFSSFTFLGLTVNSYTYGSTTVTGDAYGNLVTPIGSFNNVLRIKSDETSTDSVVITGFPTQLSTAATTSYSWSAPSHIESVISMSFTSSTSSGTTTNSTSFQYSDFTSSVSELAPMKPLEVYPNPSSNNTMVHLTADDLKAGETSFIATDATGKEVKRIKFNLRDASHKTVDIDMNDCANGIYFIRLEQKNSIFTSRFVKQ